MENISKTILGIDPGRIKCGIAVVEKNADACNILHQEVIETSALYSIVTDLTARFHPYAIVIGDGTTSAQAVKALGDIDGTPVQVVDEKFTTLLARQRYFIENPPRGLHRLIPVSLQTPGRPYDDYVAVILAERYLSTDL